MPYYNKIEIMGHLGQDGKVSATSTGKKKFTCSVATQKSYKDQKGEWQKITTWHNVVLWGPSVESLERSQPRKGELVFVTGELTSRKYTENTTGFEKTIYEINADKVMLIRNKEDNVQQPQQKPANTIQVQYADGSVGEEDLDELPF